VGAAGLGGVDRPGGIPGCRACALTPAQLGRSLSYGATHAVSGSRG